MGFSFYNPNPRRTTAGDCVIRAICKMTGRDWDSVYLSVALQGYIDKEMPSTNDVWGNYLKRIGLRRFIVPDICPNCYTVRDFCEDNPYGKFILATGSHVVAIEDGDYFDTWDSGDEIPIYYWMKGE